MTEQVFRSIDHVAYATRDAARAAAFYEALGFEKIVDAQPIEAFGVHITKLRSPVGEIVELVEPFRDNSVVSRLLLDVEACLYHVAFRVDDMTLAGQALRAQGALTITEPMDIPYPATPAHRTMKASHMYHPSIGLFEITG
ncbi:coronamic acid synthetase (plasmid) [Azospirillum sp. B510]|uniref:VOC family protein n=1 Tax=Azospirillum sp. (strain B510) TaxID=137722 RepID=UPI0001C4B944|nr:VOC family protein [Azospirillum sp. B510]BAI73715.1 coronamic acid synthetase [Azospirillum sp. B510]